MYDKTHSWAEKAQGASAVSNKSVAEFLCFQEIIEKRKSYYETIRGMKIDWDHRDIYPDLKESVGLQRFCSYHVEPELANRQLEAVITNK